MKAFLNGLIVVIFTIAVISWMGCAASKPPAEESATTSESQAQSDYDEIEKLLGIDKSATEQQQQASEKSEDDLLQLLQADEGKGQATKGEAGAEVQDQRLVNLQKENEQLKKQLRQQQIQIADLKAQLAMKEEALKKYEAGGASGGQLRIGASMAGGVAAGSMSDDEYRQTYQRALDLFHNRQYKEALRIFESLLAADTNHDLSDNAQYWIGECYYALGDYRAAIVAFEKVFTFKNSNKYDYAQYKLGLCYHRLGDRERARKELQALIDNYPNSELVPKAQQYLMQL